MPRKKNPTSGMDVVEKMNTPLAQCLSLLITDANALKDFLGCSAQAVNQYKLGISRPSLENLCKIADFYRVSTDYLLGRTNTKTPDMNCRAICERTGLNQDSVNFLINTKSFAFTKYANVINILLSDVRYHNIEKNREYNRIIDLLSFFFKYSSNGTSCVSVAEHGDFYGTGPNLHVHSTPAGSNILDTIDIDAQMVENAVLLEISRALISLKERLNEEGRNNGQHNKND